MNWTAFALCWAISATVKFFTSHPESWRERLIVFVPHALASTAAGLFIPESQTLQLVVFVFAAPYLADLPHRLYVRRETGAILRAAWGQDAGVPHRSAHGNGAGVDSAERVGQHAA